MKLINFNAKHSGVTITNDMQAAAKRANAMLKEKGREAHLSVSSETADIPGGLILRHGDIEVNCAADTLVGLYRNRLAGQVAGILFN